MSDPSLSQTQALVARDFELEKAESQALTEEELFRLLSDQIAEMIERRLEFLLSLMYRLDISEAKVNYALSPACPQPANEALAQLVLERQKQRVRTKQEYQPGEVEEGWEF